MKLRPRVALVSGLVALVSVAATGALLIAQSRRFSVEQVSLRVQLLTQNRAAALGDAVAVASAELVRLSRMAELDLGDDDLRPEAELLAHAHKNSTLFNIGLQIEDASGRCLWSEPKSSACEGRSYAGAAWFEEGRRARGPLLLAEPDDPAAVNLVVPIGGRPGAAAGVLRGLIDLRSDRIFAPALRDLVEAGAEVALVTARGRLILPGALPEGPGWRRALALGPRSPASTFATEEDGTAWLYAHAPVPHTGWTLVFRWRRAALDDPLQRQLQLLLLILAAGGLVAILLGLAAAQALTRPLGALVEGVRTLGRGRASPSPGSGAGAAGEEAGALPGARREQGEAGPGAGGASAGIARAATRSDELGELARAFDELRARLERGDARHREDLEKIRELAASLEERVRERTAALEAAQRSLLAQERLAAMGQAAAVISHELKNSLGAIGMGVDLVAGQAREAGLARAHAQVREEVARLRALTDELLVFARTPRLERTGSDLNALVRRAAGLCAERAVALGVAVSLDLAEGGAPLQLSCDPQRVQSVLVNLLQNALEAVAFRDEAAAALPREVRVATARAEGAAWVAVEDSGPGVPEEARSHLFEPFFTTKRNGTGLGLATAARFVAAHGGRIALEPAAAGGARFKVELPLEAPPAERSEAWARPS